MNFFLELNDEDILCKRLGIDKKNLFDILNNLDDHYRTESRPRKNKKPRIINVPSGELKKIQRCILKKILQKIPLPETILGSRKKISHISNACMHIGQRIVINLDIEDFYPSAHTERVQHIFRQFFPESVCNLLLRLTFYKNKLPQGTPTSTVIGNIVLIPLEKRLSNLAKQHNFKYSIYVDDITISGDKRIKNLENLFKKIIEQEGFEISKDKTSVSDKSQRQTVTKLVVNGDKPNVTKDYKQLLRAIINNCIKKGPLNQISKYNEIRQKRIKSLKQFKESLKGKILYVSQLNPQIGNRLMYSFKKINW